jgi:hypothetical protein
MNDKKPAKWGCDFVRGAGWKPRERTRKGWTQEASRYAAKQTPVMNASVSDCGDYYRINMGRQPF